jgi:gliding motility-associated-like protein
LADLKTFLIILFLFIGANCIAQIDVLEFKENKGQWNDNVEYKARIPGGNLYLEKDKLTYQFYNEEDIHRMGDIHHGFIKKPTSQDSILNLHAFHVKFLNINTPILSPDLSRSDYENYFIGNDELKWARQVKKYQTVSYQDLYHNIGLKFYLKEGNLKYDFKVLPDGNPNEIKLQYDGVDNIYLEKGNLYIITSVNEIVEQKPYAYQLVRGKEKEVKCKFILKDNVLSFVFPRGYKKGLPLIIDPVLIFASYSGATIDNFGYTSTFNDAGNLYGGGVSFGVGYPLTTGAYQTNFAGGIRDVSISKFTPDGTNLVYSTYLGGSGDDHPHSLIVNSSDELLIYGSTSSIDFPITMNAYDITQNGGKDIFVAKLSSNGTTLEGSTFVGGNADDGVNSSAWLKYNYADDYRGEIIVDNNDDIYIASTTYSTDFPTTAGVFQPLNSGFQDACVFKLSSDLTTLIWSSFHGGASDDAAYSLQFDELDNILLTGGTYSTNFPTTAGVIIPFSLGGVDGWLTKINNSATIILASTYLGTTEYDQSFFVQLDSANNVYVVGQTEGVYPITPSSVYNVANSGQFLHKLSPNLTSTIFSTTFGTGSGEVDLALSAFLVNDCNYIMISGWGGVVNSLFSQATSSTTNGLPITSNAIQSITDGSDYYLTMFSENATSLMFATFFGGNASDDHVDGGTSRFDKKGIVYQAVCSSCGIATNDFPTTPGAWSSTDNSSNCNLGVFKIDLSILTANADVYVSPYHCVGEMVNFQNLSNGGVSYFWDFGDGDTSILFEPSHSYDTAGVYNVMLISLDSASCLKKDTDYVDVYINLPPVANTSPVSVCRGDSVQLNVTGGLIFDWQPNYNILNGNTDTPIVFPDTTMNYTVIITDSCGSDTTQLLVTVNTKNINIDPDTVVCLGQSVQINAFGGINYLWSPAATLDNSNIANPISTPLQHTTYNVAITDTNNCVWDTVLTVFVDSVLPTALVSVNDTVCQGDSVEIYASGGNSYSWSPISTLSNPYDSVTFAFPLQTTNYVVEVSNACGIDIGTVEVSIHAVNANIVVDTIVCVGNSAHLWASGGVDYLWYSSENMPYITDSSFNSTIFVPTTFFVDVTDSMNCPTTLSTFVDTFINPTLEIGYDIETSWGSLITLNPITNGISFWWTPETGLSCTTCPNPIVNAQESTTYYLTVQGTNGCYNYDTITVFYDGVIYAPNSFSPDGNGVNDIFYVYGEDIAEFELSIFDRWGEKLFYSTEMNNGWNGIYKGIPAKTETYVWKVDYTDILGESGTMYGTVTLIR